VSRAYGGALRSDDVSSTSVDRIRREFRKERLFVECLHGDARWIRRSRRSARGLTIVRRSSGSASRSEGRGDSPVRGLQSPQGGIGRSSRCSTERRDSADTRQRAGSKTNRRSWSDSRSRPRA